MFHNIILIIYLDIILAVRMQSFVCMLTFCCQSDNIFKRFLINLEISTLNVNEEECKFLCSLCKKKLFTVVFFILKRVL